jgi:hypothetical protein
MKRLHDGSVFCSQGALELLSAGVKQWAPSSGAHCCRRNVGSSLPAKVYPLSFDASNEPALHLRGVTAVTTHCTWTSRPD